MAHKDIAERGLLSHNDVFANAVNALLLGGAGVIRPEDLEDAQTRTGYTAESKKLKDQERDVIKHWRGGADVRLATLGIENQSTVDNDMALRVLAYDAASYRNQIGTKGPRHPVVTIVLYFGEKPWRGPKSLLERLSVPNDLKGLVADWPLRVFDMGRLNNAQMDALKDDLRVIAGFLHSRAQGCPYEPDSDTMRHPGDVIRTLGAITGDTNWNSILTPEDDTSGETTMMTEVLQRYTNRGIQEGLEQGLEQGLKLGRAEMLAANVSAIMTSFGVDFNRACDALGVPLSEREALKAAVPER